MESLIKKEFLKKRVGLFCPAKQKSADFITGRELKELRENAGVVCCNDRLLGRLLKHREIIPRDWRKGVRMNGITRIKYILFLGTIHKDRANREYVRALYFDSKEWREERFYLYKNENWYFGNNFVVAIRRLVPIRQRRKG